MCDRLLMNRQYQRIITRVKHFLKVVMLLPYLEEPGE